MTEHVGTILALVAWCAQLLVSEYWYRKFRRKDDEASDLRIALAVEKEAGDQLRRWYREARK